jgi:UDP-glucose 4-epimerase
MQKILLTGASGFIGQQLLRYLYESDYELAIVSRNKDFVFYGAKMYCLNLEDTKNLTKVFEDFRPDYVIHNAASPNLGSFISDLQTNVICSIQLIDIACHFGVKKFIFASSGGAIYGEVSEPHRASVSDLVSPSSAYAVGKLTVENYLSAYANLKNFDYCVLRYSNIIGEVPLGEKLEYIIPKFIHCVANQQPLEVLGRNTLGDEGLLRDYIHLDDVIAANLLVLNGKIKEKIINVCTGQEIPVLRIAQLVNNYFGNSSNIHFLPPREGIIKRSVLDANPLNQYMKPMRFESALATILERAEPLVLKRKNHNFQI